MGSPKPPFRLYYHAIMAEIEDGGTLRNARFHTTPTLQFLNRKDEYEDVPVVYEGLTPERG